MAPRINGLPHIIGKNALTVHNLPDQSSPQTKQRMKVKLPDIDKRRNRYQEGNLSGLKLGSVAGNGELNKSRNGINHFLSVIKGENKGGENKLPVFKTKHLSIGGHNTDSIVEFPRGSPATTTVKQTLLQHHRDLLK